MKADFLSREETAWPGLASAHPHVSAAKCVRDASKPAGQVLHNVKCRAQNSRTCTYGLKGDGETGPTYGTGAPDYQ